MANDGSEPGFVLVEMIGRDPVVIGHEPQLGMANQRAESFASGAGREGSPIFILRAIKSVTASRNYQYDHRDIVVK